MCLNDVGSDLIIFNPFLFHLDLISPNFYNEVKVNLIPILQVQRMDPNVVSTSDWSGLPKHLLDMVLDNLIPSSDYVRFSAVCVPWYCVAMDNRKKFAKKLNRQVPMLLLPKKDEEKGEVKNLYNIITKKFVNLEVRVSTSTRYGGSSRGWLISAAEDYVVTLINPIYPGAVITLPPILKHNIEYPFLIQNVALSADPTTEPHDYKVAVIYGEQCQLAVIKPGIQDADWTYIDYIQTMFDDIIFYECRLHAVGFKGDVFCFDDDLYVPRELAPTPLLVEFDVTTYLVESLSGDLLLVIRHVEYFDSPDYRNTVKFDVYKLNSGGPIWVKLESLGGESLFLGDNMSTSVLASEFPGCCPNSIYFTHDFDSNIGLGDRGPLDAGVFNLENSSFFPHYVTDEPSLIAMTEQPPIWYTPNFLSVKPVQLGIKN